MIRLQHASKVFPTKDGEVRALDDVSLEIPQGRFAAVRGHSGSGKSTLLALIGGLALPSQGEVVVADEAISKMSSAARAEFRARHIGFVFQMFHLLPYLSVRGNVLVAAAQNGAVEQTRAEELLVRFGLADRLSHRPGQLSIGERQRVAMARALINGPQLLLADEPTGNLDPENAGAVLDMLDEFHQGGGTILLVTHDDKAAARAEFTVELERGRLVAAPADSTT